MAFFKEIFHIFKKQQLLEYKNFLKNDITKKFSWPNSYHINKRYLYNLCNNIRNKQQSISAATYSTTSSTRKYNLISHQSCMAASVPMLQVSNVTSTAHGLPGRSLQDWCSSISQCRSYTNRNILSLHERGLWKDRFPDAGLEFERSLSSGIQTVYAGFDPTADSLHIGNLLILIALLHCQRAGHRPIVLLGGFTSTVGDPSGRIGARPDLAESDAERNIASIQRTVTNIFGNHDRLIWKNTNNEKLTAPLILNNSSWLGKLQQQELLQVLKHISVKDLLRSSFIQDRLNQDIESSKLTAKELLYQVYQAYDWLYLYDNYGCKIQVGGSDQMANIWLGHDLIAACRGGACVTGLTTPLLTTPDREKLGKSAGNSVWLSSERTSYLDFYQYWLRTHDQQVEQLLKFFTFMSIGEIKQLMEKHLEKPDAHLAQKKLAEAVTLLVHGEYGMQVAEKSTDILYHNKGTALLNLSAKELEHLFSNQVTTLTLNPGTTVLSAAMQAKCFKYERDAEGAIRNGGFNINQSQVRDPHLVLIPEAHVLPSGYSLFRVGRKSYTLVLWNR
uniref:Tyrosine--tRNA ligase n=1 Tax=Hirondellea gigas TaxID=1518452 RepID=A0A2P2I3C0_9CRUS